jgi:hypothetical protein
VIEEFDPDSKELKIQFSLVRAIDFHYESGAPFLGYQVVIRDLNGPFPEKEFPLGPVFMSEKDADQFVAFRNDEGKKVKDYVFVDDDNERGLPN